uniref:NUMOD4 domain-containing protein n=1 Tax=viral metagenome TaxID=1070528 RepID=A0A6C0J8A4_9ZZZZ
MEEVWRCLTHINANKREISNYGRIENFQGNIAPQNPDIQGFVSVHTKNKMYRIRRVCFLSLTL